jgi:hypothetical protein
MTLVIGMLLLLVVLGSSAAVLAQDEPAPAAVDAACVPKAKEVVVFLDAGYAGKCAKLKIGAYPAPALFKMPDNSITSFKVGSAVRVVLFEHRDFGGFSAAYANDIPNLYYEPIANDTVSSIRVEMRPTTGCKVRGNEIAVFEHEGFQGQCIIHNVGNFSNALEIGLPDNFISSVKVGNLLRLVLYRNVSFTGITDIYNADDAALYYDTIGNDTVSSMRVEWKPKAGGCKPKPTEVAFFVDSSYKGQCIIKQIGSYPSAYEIGLPEDAISSLKVGNKVKVVLYTWADFGGDTATYQRNVPILGNEPIGNDTISSLKIMSR